MENLKTNFLGRDGFVWWIGQIPPVESWGFQGTGGGWGVRYKVRIMGYHPYTEAELSNEDLPWAHVMLPPGSGTGSANTFKSVRFNPGDTVIGFFLDGADGQHPVIMGAFANSVDAIKGGEPLPFAPFSGYNQYIKEPSSYSLKKSESGDQNIATAEPPRGVSVTDAKGADPANPAARRTSDGKVISLPCGTEGEDSKGSKGVITKIKIAVEGFVAFMQDLKAQFDAGLEYYRYKINEEIDVVTKKITEVSTKLISGMVTSLMNTMTPILQQGLDMLYWSVYNPTLLATGNPAIAHAAGVAAQTAMVIPVKVLQDLIGCIVNQIIGKVAEFVKDILSSIANNVINFVDCVGDQTVGAIVNGIIDLIDNALLPAIEGIAKILQFFEDFSVEGLLRSGIDALLGALGLQSCSKVIEKDKYGACKYRLGYGPASQDAPDLEKIIGDANTANAISTAAQAAGFPLDGVQDIVGAYDIISGTISDPDFIGDLGSCYAGIPVVCNPPTVNIFGGGGTGAEAVPLFGALFDDTASIIDIQVTNPGSGYTYPPYVEVVDNCEQGYGAVAKAEINENGEVENIYIVSEGENYPVQETTVPPYIVDTVTIINPGQGYEVGDTAKDNQGNEYELQIQFGSIVKVNPVESPINRKDVTNIPVIEVITDTGSGAILVAKLAERPPLDDTQDVKSVIDCIT